MHRPSTSNGFTLLEIMVALTVGGIALGSLYAVGSASTRHFREQQRISSAQTALRAAMDTLKHDFQRAGYMSTPNSRLAGEACVEPSTVENRWVGAVNRYDKNAPAPSKLDPDSLNTTVDNFYAVDDVWLTGNYSTSGEYPNISVSADGLTVSIPQGWQSFQRDFSEWNGTNVGTCNVSAFQAAFTPGRLVRLHAMNGTYFYSRIANATCSTQVATPAVVTLRDAVPTICNMDGGWIAPLNTMRYHVMDATAAEDDALGRTTILRRTEVMPDQRVTPLTAAVASGVINVEDRALLDYVVRFSVDFLMSDGIKVNHVPMTENEMLTAPQAVRGVVLDVAVRTPQQETTFTADIPRASFRLFQPGRGAARVRRMRAELLLSNIADRNRI